MPAAATGRSGHFFSFGKQSGTEAERKRQRQ